MSSSTWPSPIPLHGALPCARAELAALTDWCLTQRVHIALVCLQRAKCCWCSSVERKKEDGVSRFKPGVYLYVFCRLLGRDMSENTCFLDPHQFLRSTPNPRSLSFSRAIDNSRGGTSVVPSSVIGGTLTFQTAEEAPGRI